MPGKKYYFWRQRRNQKLLWPTVVFILCWTIIVFRLVHLQLIMGNYYLNRADRNRIHFSFITPPRGEILDRRGIQLAGSRPNYSLYITVEGLKGAHAEDTASVLEEITSRSKKDTLRRLASLKGSRKGAAVLFPHLSRDEIISIEENSHRLGWVFIQKNPIRKYTLGEGLSHFIGYVGEINRQELEEKRKFGYRLKDIIGKTGIEKEHDLHLKGRPGYRKTEVGVDGSYRKVLQEVSPQIGDHIVTTIDMRLQKSAASAMEGQRGAVAAMDPYSGDLLIWFSTPGFDPHEFTVTLPLRRARDLLEDPLSPLFDRVLKGRFSPGSVFKTVVALAALENEFNPGELQVECRGSMLIGYDRRVFRCWKEEGHGKVGLKEAIADSCNIFFYRLGAETGAEKILETARKMGMGERVQKIFPGESKGLLPWPEWKRERFKEIWYPGDTANLSIGQGYILVTPMQLLRLTSIIGSGGRALEPRAVKMVVSGNESGDVEVFPSSRERTLFNPENIGIIREAMLESVEYGTGSSMKYYGVNASVAGKTGTAENPLGPDHSWFISFAPYENPEIAMVVLVEHGGSGAAAALPVAARILREKFSLPRG